MPLPADDLRISLIIPSFNQGAFIEKTILSILSQGYGNLELIVIDGLSTDATCTIIRRYGHELSFWVSEPDNGQADALNKGFRMATGDVLGFINSDDLLLPGALSTIAQKFRSGPTIKFVVGKSLIIDQNSQVIDIDPGIRPSRLSLVSLGTNGFMQPACFWHRDVYEAVGDVDYSLQYAFDYDFFIRVMMRYKAHTVNEFLAGYRMHPESKTSRLAAVKRAEDELIKLRYSQQGLSNHLRRLVGSAFFIRAALRRRYCRLKYRKLLGSVLI